jgi:hypothetical protein
MEQIMNNTIYITPSHDQLLEISKNNPELYSSIKNSLLKDLKDGAIKFAQKKWENQTYYMYDKAYNDLQKKILNVNLTNNVQKELEQKFKQKIEEKIQSQFDAEFEEYLNSDAFKRTLSSKLKDKILTTAMILLDKEIQAEAKKLIS